MQVRKTRELYCLLTVDGGGDVRELKLIEGYALSAELVNLISWPSFAELSFPGCDPRDDEIDADANSMTRSRSRLCENVHEPRMRRVVFSVFRSRKRLPVQLIFSSTKSSSPLKNLETEAFLSLAGPLFGRCVR